MKITFMGTGAADFKISQRKENEFFRRLSGAVIDNDLMIDCSADMDDYIKMTSTTLLDVKNLIVTHTHSDHYSPETIKCILDENIKIWTEENATMQISKELPKHKVEKLNLFTSEKVGGYTVIGVPANHIVADEKQIPLHYIIEKDDKTIFWGCDGAWFLCRSWHEIKKHKYDLIVLDGTLGEELGDYRIFEHNNIRMICEMAETIRSGGMLKENGKIVISHMAKYAHKTHEELKEYMDKYNIEVTYDGMEMEI